MLHKVQHVCEKDLESSALPEAKDIFSWCYFFFFTKNSRSEFFVKKNSTFRPAGGDTPRRMQDRLIHTSTGRFAVFAHFAAFVVQTRTA